MMETTKMTDRTELPKGIRLPLHKLQADMEYMFGRVAADGSVAATMAHIVVIRLKDIEQVILDWHETLIDCLEYFENRADADADSETGFIPNDEMLMASKIKEVLAP